MYNNPYVETEGDLIDLIGRPDDDLPFTDEEEDWEDLYYDEDDWSGL